MELKELAGMDTKERYSQLRALTDQEISTLHGALISEMRIRLGKEEAGAVLVLMAAAMQSMP